MDDATREAVARVAAHMEARRWMFPANTEKGTDIVSFAWDAESKPHELTANDLNLVLDLAHKYIDLAE